MKKILSILVGLSLAAASVRAEVYQHIVAHVGSDIITSNDVEEALSVVKGQMDPQELQSAEGQKRLQDMRKEILQHMVEDRLVIQEAQKVPEQAKEDKEAHASKGPNPMLPTQDELDDAVTQAFDQARGRFPSEEAFQKELQRERITEEGLKARLEDSVRDQLVLKKMRTAKMKEFQPDIKVGQDEARGYFEAHPDEFGGGEEVKLSQIVISSRRKDGQALAASLKDKLKGGESFGSLAKRYSDEAGSKTVGGELGWIERGGLRWPEVEQAAFAGRDGQVLGPIHTESGWHLVKVEGHRRSEAKNFEELRGKVMNAVFQKKMADRLQAWMEDLKKKTYVEITD
jgi:parvulin-like peptidyl-prolyl isomerase